MDACEWEWSQCPGLPEGGGASEFRFFGFDSDMNAYVLNWDNKRGHWVAVGFDDGPWPIVHVIRENNAELIKSHAACPLRWSQLGLP